MTIGKKIGLSFFIIIVFVLSLSLFVIYEINQLDDLAETALDTNHDLEFIIRAERDHLSWLQSLSTVFTEENINSLDIALDHKQCGFGQWYYSDQRKKLEDAYPDLKPLFTKIESFHSRLHHSGKEINDIISNRGNSGLRNTDNNGISSKESVINKARNVFINKTAPSINELRSIMAQMINILEEAHEKTQKQRIEGGGDIKYIVRLVSFLVILFAVIIAVYIIKTINYLLTDISENLYHGSSQIDATANQLSSSSQSMASGAGQQAASIEEISASLEELSSQIQHNAENSFKAKQVSTVTSESAQKGIIVIEKMKDSINRIKSSSDETAKIVKTIDEIAFQTNLLALNAAVEAARAGEAGKGFAVVAEEVRNLAQRSAEAAKNTSALIMESQDNANSGVGVTEEVASIFLNISQDINKISALNEEVSQASSEQSSGIKQLSEGIHQIDSVTQSSAAQSEEIASSSEELASQANIFVGLVEKLLKMVKG